MRKYIFVLCTAACAVLSACSNEALLQQTDESSFALEGSDMREIVISAYSGEEGVVTKTSRDDEGTFYWSPGDQISIFNWVGSQGGSLFTATCSEPSQISDFTGSISDQEAGGDAKYWGIYPYNEANECDSTSVITVVPSEQVAAEGTFADGQFVSIGCSSTLSMGFYHLCGGIKFFLQEDGITRIGLTGNSGETLAGKVQVTLDDEGHPVVKTVKTARKEIVLTPPKGETSFRAGVNYFFVTLPVNFSKGFTVTFEKGNEGTYGIRYISSAMKVNRAKFQWSRSAIDTGVVFVTKGSFDEPEYQDIENSGVRAYLESVDYSSDLDSYNESYVTKYTGSGDKPNPVTVKWTGTASSLMYSTSPNFDSDVQTVSVSTSSTSIYNLVPEVKYYYRVTTGNGFILKEGCVVPYGPLRMIKASTSNFRDLGGWKGLDGRTIAYGKLYRGAQINSSDRSLFQSLGIGVDLDLRGNGGGSARQVFSDIEYNNYQVYQFMYNGSTPGYTQELYQEALHYVINCLYNEKVVFFHCIGGADRTGTLAFLIEALLDVSENDLSKDYELTSFYSTRTRNDNGTRPFRQLVFYLKTFEGETIQEKVYNWATTRHSDTVDPLDPEEIEFLRDYMLVK